jgi:general secretion pathway protein D
VPLRLEPMGSTLVVHIPARRSDREAHTDPITLLPAVFQPPAALPARIAAASDRVSIIVKLSYADVSEVAGALVKGAVVPSNDVFTATSPFSPPTQSSGYGSGSGGASRDIPPPPTPTYVTIPAGTLLPKDTPQGVRFDDHVAVDRRLNAVILSGTQAEVDVLRAMVAQLDVPAPSVLLETQIVELTVSGAKDLGLDYSPNGSSLATASFGVASGSKPTASLSMSATVAALEQSGQAKILARPRILSLNNRPAAILSGEAVPIFTSIITGNPSVVQQQVQYINVGVSLQILPRIALDGKVTTQIFCEVSSIIDFVQNTPRIAVRQELTSAVVNDSESLIVGGLLQENEIRNLKKVPGLGNLPLVGGFFKDVSNSSQNTNLYIVITPHILTNGATGNAAYDLPAQPQPLPTIPPPDPALVPGEMATPPPVPR